MELVKKYKELFQYNKTMVKEVENLIFSGETFILTGKSGVGKTELIRKILKESPIERIDMNSTTLRSTFKDLETSSLSISMESFSEDQKSRNTSSIRKTILVVDDIDGVDFNLNDLAKRMRTQCIFIGNERIKNSRLKEVKFKKIDLKYMPRLLSEISRRENISLTPGQIEKIVRYSNDDIRYCLNTLEILRRLGNNGSMNIENYMNRRLMGKNPFEMCVEIMEKSTIDEKLEIFFRDYMLIPSFIFENYIRFTLKDRASRIKKDVLRKYSIVSDSISYGDILRENILKTQDWSELPLVGFYGVAYPTYGCSLKFFKFPAFKKFEKGNPYILSLTMKLGKKESLPGPKTRRKTKA